MSRSASPSKARPSSRPAAATVSARRSGCVEPHPSLMFVPFGASKRTVTSAPSAAEQVRRDVARPIRWRSRCRCGSPDERVSGDSCGGGAGTPRRRSASARTRPSSAFSRSTIGDGSSISQSSAASIVVVRLAAGDDDLQAVVGRRVVRCRDHDPGRVPRIGARVDEARRGDHAEIDHVGPGRRESGDEGGAEHLPRSSGVASERRCCDPGPPSR